MITGYTDPQKDPYIEIATPTQIQGEFRYNFSANVLNTSKEATQAALQALLATFVNPLAIQMGITTADGVYRLFRDYGKSLGQDSDKYITAPSVTALDPPIFVEEAIDTIMEGQLPRGNPAEGFDGHLQLLQAFTQSTQFGVITDPAVLGLFTQYMQRIAQLAEQERQRQQLLAAAQQFSQQSGGRPGTEQPTGSEPRNSTAPLGENELKDETLPSAGGGANPGPGAQ